MGQGAKHYYCHGFSLDCYQPAYLVEVNEVQAQNISETPVSDLPEWVFSRNAIWLTGTETSMFIRSMHGDEIKNILWDINRENFGSGSRRFANLRINHDEC